MVTATIALLVLAAPSVAEADNPQRVALYKTLRIARDWCRHTKGCEYYGARCNRRLVCKAKIRGTTAYHRFQCNYPITWAIQQGSGKVVYWNDGKSRCARKPI